MANVSQPILPVLTLIGALMLGPCGAEAKVIPKISIPAKTFKVVAAIGCANDIANNLPTVQGALQGQVQASPALIGEPTFSGGNKRLTAWGRGWFSENDQTIAVNPDRSVTWTDGQGNQYTFSETSGSTTTLPVYAVPAGMYVSLTAVSHSSGTPTALSERDPDGTTRLFAVQGSTKILRFSQLADRNNNTVIYTRDGQGRLTRMVDIHGRYFELTYSTSGFVASLSDGGGRTTVYSYDAQGRRVGEAGSHGATAYEYDNENRMTKITYPNGSLKNYAYDAQHRLQSEDDGNGNNRLSYVYGSTSTTITDALGRATVHEYAVLHGVKKVVKTTDPSGGVTRFTYDDNLNLLTQTDPMGRVTRFTYDSRGNVTVTQDAAGGYSRATYEPVYNLTASQTDPLDHSTYMTYDAKGNLTQVQAPLSFITHMAYDSFGHVSLNTDPMGRSTSFTYEPTNGARASVTDPLSRTTGMQTDALSRVVRNTDPSGKVTQYSYDAAGNLLQATDAMNGVTHYAYAPGRTAKLLASVTDALGHSTSFGYDDLGRRTSVTNALGQSKAYTFDAKGNLTSSRNARNQTITYAYDNLDRLITKTMPEGVVHYTYDAAGNMVNVTQPNGSGVATSYDALNRPTQVVQTLPGGFSATIGYTYDAAGNRTQMSTPWGNFSYAYDADDRLIRITNPQGRVFAFSYDANGRRTSLSYPNGIVASYGYDLAGQLLSLTHARTSDGVVIASAAYVYDQAGNRTSMTDGAGTHRYGYDNLYRLTSASHPAGSGLHSESFAYDGVGNRLAEAGGVTYGHDAANRLLQSSSFTYTYDDNGNLTGRTDRVTQAQESFVYNSLNQLTQANTSSGTMNAKYDAAGRRVEKTVNDTIYRYVYDGMRILTILDDSNNVVELFTNGPGLGEPLVMHKDDGTDFFFHSGGVGSVVALTSAGGSAVEAYQYSTFGQPVVKDAQGGVLGQTSVGNPFLCAGAEYDQETGFGHMGYRYLDPDAGRWTQEDPIGLGGGLNLYAYALNNPIRYADPLGLKTVVIITFPPGGGPGHTGLYVERGGRVTVYDPEGAFSYDAQGPQAGGSGHLFEGGMDLAKAYQDFEREGGWKIEPFVFDTTPEEEAEILNAATEYGGGAWYGLGCTDNTSGSLEAVPRFRGIHSYLPSSLARRLRKMQRRGGK